MFTKLVQHTQLLEKLCVPSDDHNTDSNLPDILLTGKALSNEEQTIPMKQEELYFSKGNFLTQAKAVIRKNMSLQAKQAGTNCCQVITMSSMA